MTVYAKNYVFPEHIQIETIRGVCTSKCIMCTINSWKRSHEKMSLQQFESLLKKLEGNKRQKFLTLHGLGEPLLDKELPEKITLAKKYNFNGVGFATNCTELTEELSKKLLKSKLDTIICSIDGFTKSIHESIRIGTNFDMIVKNVENFLSIRNDSTYKTKVLLRFINQSSNFHEWNDYYQYWNQRINKNYGDDVLKFDVHNWGNDNKMAQKTTKIKGHNASNTSNEICDDLENRLIIQATGRISFCCADDNDYFKLGNAFLEPPYLLYNSKPFTVYREVMRQGKLRTLAPCATCSILTSRQTRILPDS